MPQGNDGSASGFAGLTLAPQLCFALSDLGFEEPTPIQRAAIPALLKGHDLLGQAATGTGKTAAFALPILQRVLARDEGDAPLALVLVPTRELAMQVCDAILSYGQDLGARVVAVYGGAPITHQMRALRSGADVVVATPGRAQDLIRRGKLHLGELETVVLDEADEMLDMGFAEEIEAILEEIPSGRQTALFSATMPPRIAAIVNRHLNNPVRIELGSGASASPDTSLVRQVAYYVPRGHKAAALSRVLDLESPKATLIFCHTRDEVDELTQTLNACGRRAEALHGGMDQPQRERTMGRLRSEAINLLVATDVAARGLDIEHLSHVVNYNVPGVPESYVHRTGRVGRAGRAGTAITLVEPGEHRKLRTIERVTGLAIPLEKLPTAEALRARRLELTRSALRDVVLKEELDAYRAVVEPLAEEFGLYEVALAAVRLAHAANGSPLDEEELPDIELPGEERRRAARGEGARPGRWDRGEGPQTGRWDRGESSGRGDRTGHERAGRGDQRGSHRDGGTTRVFVGIGRSAGIRPQDLVGAIAGESHLSGRDIGAIKITDRFSLVEVPESAADDVIEALRRSGVKGQRSTVRRERY
jgi:ATP-dependent RNA helicase DeaD